MRVLQTLALPLGYGADRPIVSARYGRQPLSRQGASGDGTGQTGKPGARGKKGEPIGSWGLWGHTGENMYPQMGCSELLRRLSDDEVLVLDCRGDRDWHRFEVHIPGALRVPLEELPDCAEVLPDDELIVVCDCSPDGSDA